MLPVDPHSNDPFCRYKMHSLLVSYDSNRTVLSNLQQIAKELYREPEHLSKFIAGALGTNQIQDKGRYALKGNFEGQRIQKLIYNFIELFVLCRACNNPETRFVMDGELKRACSSCGAVEPQEEHKLNATIMKDIEKGVVEDTRYNKNNGADIGDILKRGESDRLYDLFKQESWGLENLIIVPIKSAQLQCFSKIFAEFKPDQILGFVEDLLEANKSESSAGAFLRVLCTMGMSIDDVDAYFSIPRTGKKRSPLLKKNAAHFIDNYED